MSRTPPTAEGPFPQPSSPQWLVGTRRAQSASGRSLFASEEDELYPLVIILAKCCHEESASVFGGSRVPFVIILCQPHVGTLVAQRTTGHTCHVIKSSSSASLVLVSFVVLATLTVVASRCYASSSDTLDRSQYQHQRTYNNTHRIIAKSSTLIPQPPRSPTTASSNKLVLSDSSRELVARNNNNSNNAGAILRRSKREYLAAFDNLLDFYREESAKRDDRRLSETEERRGQEEETAAAAAAAATTTAQSQEGGASVVADREDASASIADGTDDVNVYADVPAPPPPPVNKGFPFESSTQRSMPPAHVSGNSLNDSGVLVLVVSVVVLTVTLGLVTCVLTHYRGGTAANSHDAAQTPTTAPMLSVVSAGAAAGVGGMDRLRSRGATARDLASSRDRREVRVHAVHTDIAINFPPSIALPDGEDHPFNSRLQLRNAEQEAEMYQKCIKPPPNRTVLESESPPPYRSSSAGLLGSISGSSSSSASTDWSGGSAPPLVVRCHSMSSTSKRQDNNSSSNVASSGCGIVGCATAAAAAGQKTDFIQRTVKRFTGNKERKGGGQTLSGVLSSSSSAVTSAPPVVIVPTKPRRISEHQQHLHLQQQQQQQQQQQSHHQQAENSSCSGRPRQNV